MTSTSGILHDVGRLQQRPLDSHNAIRHRVEFMLRSPAHALAVMDIVDEGHS
jgi:hypothetical protein